MQTLRVLNTLISVAVVVAVGALRFTLGGIALLLSAAFDPAVWVCGLLLLGWAVYGSTNKSAPKPSASPRVEKTQQGGLCVEAIVDYRVHAKDGPVVQHAYAEDVRDACAGLSAAEREAAARYVLEIEKPATEIVANSQ